MRGAFVIKDERRDLSRAVLPAQRGRKERGEFGEAEGGRGSLETRFYPR